MSMSYEKKICFVCNAKLVCNVRVPEIDVAYTCNKCKLVALLEEKVRGLEWRVSTLQGRTDGEEFLDRALEL